MGVGPPEGGNPPVQKIAHRQLFAGGLGVKINQSEVRLFPLQQLVYNGKGIIRPPIQVASSNQIHHPDAHAVQIKNPPAPARRPTGVIGRAENIGVLVQKVHNLRLVKAVVAQRNDVRPRVVNALRLLRRQSHSGGIFTVHHSEGNIFQFFQGPQRLFQMSKPRLTHHVAHS
ncbi:hypothetical protein SDC9_78868 [bioreactor metagenome]|uniref:Uncharacterized protein n=1 Tax=bioreactor metagenome TaxID=1076179 RepID=A0A644YUV1_9ZZZZ